MQHEVKPVWAVAVVGSVLVFLWVFLTQPNSMNSALDGGRRQTVASGLNPGMSAGESSRQDELLSARTEPPAVIQPASTPASLTLLPRGKVIVRVFEDRGSRVSRPACSECKNALPAADATRCGFCQISLKPAAALKCPNCAGNGRWQCSGCNGTATVTESCLECKGTGKIDIGILGAHEVRACYKCNGAKKVQRACYKCFGYERRVGKGYIECSYCGGRGTVN